MASIRPNLAPYVIWTVPDPVPDSVYESIARQNTRPRPLASDSIANLARSSFGFQSNYWSLKARHLLYWKRTPGTYVNGQPTVPSDCLANTGPNFSMPGLAALGLAQQGLGGAEAGVSAAVSAAGGAAQVAGTTLGDIFSALPVIGSALSIVTLGIGSIEKHHAEAVAKEQGTLCELVPPINALLDQVDAAVASGQMSIDQAVQDLEGLLAQLTQAASSIEQDCNEACVIEDELSSQIALRQWLAANVPADSAGILGGISPVELAIGGAVIYEVL